MTGSGPEPDEAAAHRWLTDQHDTFVTDLASALDLGAGLREATIPAQHRELVSDLTGVLDLDTGVAAIISESKERKPNRHRPRMSCERCYERLYECPDCRGHAGTTLLGGRIGCSTCRSTGMLCPTDGGYWQK